MATKAASGSPRSARVGRWIRALESIDCTAPDADEGTVTKDLTIAPFVQILAPPPRGIADEQQKRKVWKNTHRQIEQRVLKLLDAFYLVRKAPTADRLALWHTSRLGDFRIQSAGAGDLPSLDAPLSKRLEISKRYGAELDAFAAFILSVQTH